MQLHGHSYKPETKFFGTGPYHLGIELEMEAPTFQAHSAGLELVAAPQHFYAKQDGSLRNGWELVTHPFAKEEWLRNPSTNAAAETFNLVNRLKGIGYRSHESNRCGLHVHVSRTAFTNPRRCTTTQAQLRSPHYYWFARLINGPLFRKLSQRTQSRLDRWARQLPANRLIPGVERANRYNRYGYLEAQHYHGRYEACNINPVKTVEVRIFRGNMREDRVRAMIESVIAAVEFARDSDNWGKKELDQQFIAWVGQHSETYSNLYNYLVELRLAAGSRVAGGATPVRRERTVVSIRGTDLVARIMGVMTLVPMKPAQIKRAAGLPADQVIGWALTNLVRGGQLIRGRRGYSRPGMVASMSSGSISVGR